MNTTLNLLDALESEDQTIDSSRGLRLRQHQTGPHASARFARRSKGPKSHNGVHRRGTKRLYG